MPEKDGQLHQDTREKNIEDLFDIADGKILDEDSTCGPLYQSLLEENDRYQNAEMIAKGGMKSIYKVFDNKTGRNVAMAQLHGHMGEDAFEPFLREAKLTACLDHPNIISVYDIGLTPQNKPYFTMELKTGKGLQDVIRGFHHNKKTQLMALDMDHLLDIFEKICDAMAYAHSQNVIHLDLKPENIQIGHFGEVIICDWGLGRVLGQVDYTTTEEESQSLNPDLLNNMTLGNRIKGTPGFMAPEQIEERGYIGKHSDIYALGAILYSLITGAPPFGSIREAEKALKMTLDGNITPPDLIAPHLKVPPGLSAVAMKALQRDASKRYPSIEELHQDIKFFIADRSTKAEKAGFFKELILFYKRNRSICLSISIFLIILSITTSFFVHKLKLKIREANQAKIVSETNAAIAIEEKNRTQRALDLYRKEKGWTSEFVQKNTPSLVKNVYQLSDIDVFDKTQEALSKSMNYLNRMLDERPNFTWALRQRAYLYFLTQDLGLSIKDYRTLKNLDANDENYLRIAQKYKPKDQKGIPLEIDSLSQMLRELCQKKHYLPQALIIMLYDSDIRKNRNDHAKLVKTILEICNPEWRGEEFNFDPSRSKPTLKIMGKGLKTVNLPLHQFVLAQRPTNDMNLALLKTLDIDILDMKGTDIDHLKQFRDLSILELDARNTPIHSLKSIDLLPQLKKMIVSKGQIVDMGHHLGGRVEIKQTEP